MFRPVVRRVTVQSASRSVSRNVPSQRFLSTAPPHKTSRSWKNSAVRWGLAGTLIYYYNTTNVFAEEPSVVRHSPPETSIESETLPTLDSVTAQRQAQAKAKAEAEARKQAAASQSATAAVDAQVPGADEAAPGSPEQLEEEAGQQGAFNEETGEINWDCPCLGGMAHGPCGPQFREAFSCFVFSKEEPKGMDCIDKFKGMQNCFREHPDVYGAELDDEEAEAREGQFEGEEKPSQPKISSEPSHGEKVSHTEPDHPEAVQEKRGRSAAATEQVKKDHDVLSESDELVPKAWHNGK